MQQTVGPRPAGLSGGIEPHARFADPDKQAADPRSQGYSRVGHAGARLQHEAGQTTNRDVRANTVPVHNDERAVENIELAALDE